MPLGLPLNEMQKLEFVARSAFLIKFVSFIGQYPVHKMLLYKRI